MTGGSRSVSVVIPAYNAGRTLQATLASVAGQIERPCRVVLVDDGSDDDTVEVARRWQAQLDVRVIELSSNRGPGHCRNVGVEHSGTALVAFLDADDVWFPNHLHTCLALQDVYGGVVSARGLRWHEELGILPGQGEDGPVGPPEDGLLPWIVRHHTFGMHAVMPRGVFEEAGGFDTMMEGAEDWDLWLRLAARGVPMRRTETRTFLYRQHAGNLSRQVDRVADAGRRVLDRFTADHQPLSPELSRAVRDSRALIAFNQASARIDEGRYGDARRAAARAVRGPAALSARAGVIVAAPRLFARARRRGALR